MRESRTVDYAVTPLKCIVLLVTAFSLGHAQSPPTIHSAPLEGTQRQSPPSIIGAGGFVSLEGRFSISLPEHNHGFRPLSLPTPFGSAKGIAYIWNMKEGSFVVGHAEASRSMEDPQTAAQFFTGLRDQLKKLAAANKGRVGPEREVHLGSHPGLEQRLELFTGSFVQRTYIVGGRLYQALFILNSDQQAYESVAAGVLDSLKVLNESDVARQKSQNAAAAEPSPLPQQPVVPRVSDDATDEGLRGPVKSVLTESEDLSGTWSVQGRKRNWFDNYDERRNLTRRATYDYRGNLSSINVYGYIDGGRVMSSKTIEHEYNPPPMVVGAPPSAKKSDPRYHYKFEFKYDQKKRLTEKTWFQSNGDVWLRYVYKYTGNQREELVYSADGSLNQRYQITLDEKGNEIEQTSFETRDVSIRSKRSYKYEFDTNGNWIKRTALKVVSKDGRESNEPDNVYHRTITYYR